MLIVLLSVASLVSVGFVLVQASIAWDDEQPPLYEDVPASPPCYNVQVSNYDGSELNEEIENFHLSS